MAVMSCSRSASPNSLPPSKKAKLDASGPIAKPAFASPRVLIEQAPKLNKEFAESEPYRHCVAQDLFSDELLREVRKEIYEHLEFTLKETDIYRVYQTGDLANLDGLEGHEAMKLRHIRQIRDALYSPAFRSFLAEVTGCGPLSGKQTDMSINDYREGCHLLNHDDVIGTRRVSFILYLTDPDNAWTREDGGALELYPVVNKGTPANEPSKIIPPRFNQFTFFTVQPGHSFHAVEEVFSESKARLSISGWFHLPHSDEPGYDASRALMEKEAETAQGPSLQQLKGKSDIIFTPVASQAGDSTTALTEADQEYLKQYLNPAYLSPAGISQVSSRFVEDSHVVLSKFLASTFATKIRNAIQVTEAASISEDPVPSHNSATGDGSWVVRGPPHRQRFLVPSSGSSSRVTELLGELASVTTHAVFLKWVTAVTTLVISTSYATPRRFRPGLDYTLATSHEESGLLELNLALTPSAGWDDGQMGGWECYMPPADEGKGDPAVYAAAEPDADDEGGALLTTYPAWNQATLALRDAGVLCFTKYVSARAGGSSWDVRASYEFFEDSEE